MLVHGCLAGESLGKTRQAVATAWKFIVVTDAIQPSETVPSLLIHFIKLSRRLIKYNKNKTIFVFFVTMGWNLWNKLTCTHPYTHDAGSVM
jgi:hypothetical protein